MDKKEIRIITARDSGKTELYLEAVIADSVGMTIAEWREFKRKEGDK